MPWIKPVRQKEMKNLDIKEEVPVPSSLFDRLIANEEKLYDVFLPLQRAIKGVDMPNDLREAIITFVSMRNGCRYCTKSHSEILKEYVDQENVLEWLDGFRESSMDEEWKAVLTYADHLISKPVQVSKNDVERLKDQGYDDRKIAQLNQVVAYTSYTNQLSIGLGL